MGSILIMARHISTFLPDLGDVINNASGDTVIERDVQGDIINEADVTIVDVEAAEFNGASDSVQIEYPQVTPMAVSHEATFVTLSEAEYEARMMAGTLNATTLYLITENAITVDPNP